MLTRFVPTRQTIRIVMVAVVLTMATAPLFAQPRRGAGVNNSIVRVTQTLADTVYEVAFIACPIAIIVAFIGLMFGGGRYKEELVYAVFGAAGILGISGIMSMIY